jgi:hypothetical protein
LTLASHDEATAAPLSRANVPTRSAEGRPRPKAICVLLPVWGDEFINQFLEQSLPTLLAPGNIPALAKTLPTRFVFLTRARDETTIRDHPAYRKLRENCDVGVVPIDDLITQGNHSTTVTLAYARAVRQAGEAMLDTCFFFLVSDYIMADGSLAAVLARMEAGASAVQVGNFQLDEETAEPWLLERLADAGASLALSPREIMGWAIGCLHPITAANTVNYPLCHNTHANRLLWRVDAETLIGRFYLLHMICIRPEVVDFVVGSSCDYSFVPEMCPSGTIATITDSDDYLVVEIQPDHHERNFLRLGPISIDGLSKSLSEWTTARHRANAEQTIVFHAAELPASLPAIVAESDRFIGDLEAQLAPVPQPHRNHPYWLGAMAAFDAAVSRREAGATDPSLPALVRITLWLRRKLLGRMPEVTRLHPRWKDLQRPLAACKQLAAEPPPHLLIGASRSTALAEWLRRRIPEAIYFLPRRLKRHPPQGIKLGGSDTAFVELLDNDITEMDYVLRQVIPLMRPGAEIIVFAFHDRWFADPRYFGRVLAEGLGSLARSGLWPVEYHIGTASRLRWWINDATVAVARVLIERPTVFLPLHVLAAASLLPLMVGVNLISSWTPNRPLRGRIASSVFIRFRLDGPRPQQPAAR